MRVNFILRSIGVLLVVFAIFSTQQLNSQPSESTVLVESNKTFDYLPDFAKYVDVKEKKSAFFNFLLPILNRENAAILSKRKNIKELFIKGLDQDLIDKDIEWLKSVCIEYTIEYESKHDNLFRDKILLRVDIVPPSQALAQASNESAWGTSRFARNALNLFGEWTFNEEEGLVPERRDAGKTHLVRKFKDVNSSIRSYTHSLNTRNAYKEFREIRASSRENGEYPQGLKTVDGLFRYSARGYEYIKELKSMINYNNLAGLDIADPPSLIN
jgi:Bax protein